MENCTIFHNLMGILETFRKIKFKLKSYKKWEIKSINFHIFPGKVLHSIFNFFNSFSYGCKNKYKNKNCNKIF